MPKPKKGATTKKAAFDSFDIQRCQGSYLVRCKEAEKGWESQCCYGLSMDITSDKHGTMKATYHFGLIEGTMILSLSEEILDAMMPNKKYAVADEEEEEEWNLLEGDYDSSDVSRKGNGKKRLKPATTNATGRNQKGKDAKKRKLAPSLSRRVYYLLRGRETGEGRSFEPECGHLDFLNDNCTKFAGLAYQFPCIDKNIEFQGYKLSNKPGGETDDEEEEGEEDEEVGEEEENNKVAWRRRRF
ncbi:hypothetical protein B0T10DRAFT_563539 [Thelonectria olida]|uniref:Uncharacterized protein n=1 Tax=Thelonectria olida TaxID=1576542 RepID=A0A9P8W1A0_9HYPO|nr:hypothetical protein B0T10DRAFT_563539 [Thelonectria olida]